MKEKFIYSPCANMCVIFKAMIILCLWSLFQAKDEASLSELAKTLTASEIDHKLWVEQPENYPTCLATRPYPKETIMQYFKQFKLLK
jgi:hypothetical protein